MGGDTIVVPTTEGLLEGSSVDDVASFVRLLPSEIKKVSFEPNRWVWHCYNADLIEMTSYEHAASEAEAWDALVALHINLFEVRLKDGTWLCSCPSVACAQAIARGLMDWAMVEGTDVLLWYTGTEAEARALWKRIGFDCR